MDAECKTRLGARFRCESDLFLHTCTSNPRSARVSELSLNLKEKDMRSNKQQKRDDTDNNNTARGRFLPASVRVLLAASDHDHAVILT